MQNLDSKFVYGNLKEEDKQNIINIWLSTGVLSKEEAIKRVEQVSVMIYSNDFLVGVSTVYPAYLTPNTPYFFFRMFIKQEFRGNNNFLIKIMRLNFKELKNKFTNKLNGIVIELENKKLAHLGETTNYFSDRGYAYFGKSTRNLQLWYVNFNEPKGIFLK